jgi:hypothetical protein
MLTTGSRIWLTVSCPVEIEKEKRPKTRDGMREE